VQSGFLDHHLRPHQAEQFVLGDEMSGAIDERNQQIESARAQRNRCPVLQQPSLVGLELEGAEAVGLRWTSRCHCRESGVSNGQVYAAGAAIHGHPWLRRAQLSHPACSSSA
jgi:hypothetical protein